jgi:hypothetical protein
MVPSGTVNFEPCFGTQEPVASRFISREGPPVRERLPETKLDVRAKRPDRAHQPKSVASRERGSRVGLVPKMPSRDRQGLVGGHRGVLAKVVPVGERVIEIGDDPIAEFGVGQQVDSAG